MTERPDQFTCRCGRQVRATPRQAVQIDVSGVDGEWIIWQGPIKDHSCSEQDGNRHLAAISPPTFAGGPELESEAHSLQDPASVE